MTASGSRPVAWLRHAFVEAVALHVLARALLEGTTTALPGTGLGQALTLQGVSES